MSARSGAILAIDLGSTSFKAAVFGPSLRLRGTGAAALRYVYGAGGAVELQPAVVDAAIRGAVRRALRAADVPAQRIRALAITSQAQTFAVTDHAFRPRMPFVSWRDLRARTACEALHREPALRDLAAHASFPALLSGLLLCQLRHLHDSRPKRLAGDVRILPLPAYLVARLCGRPACDANLAAMSGLYSMAQGGWWPAALAACGIAAAPLPEVAPIGAVAGRTRKEAAAFGLPAGVPVVLAGNDQTAGAYGAGVHARDALLITLGTCQVAYRAPAAPPAAGRVTAAGPYPGGCWYAMAAHSCGGDLINWAKTLLAGCGTDARFFAAAAAAPRGCRGLVFSPGDADGEGVWSHLAPGQTAGDFARSIIEELVRRMTRLVATLEGKTPAARLLVAGGGSRARVWTAMLAEALGRPLKPVSADPLLGAARMAMEAAGRNSGDAGF
jgi:xylulokinase